MGNPKTDFGSGHLSLVARKVRGRFFGWFGPLAPSDFEHYFLVPTDEEARGGRGRWLGWEMVGE